MKKMVPSDEAPLSFSENVENNMPNGCCLERGSNEITPRKRILVERNGFSTSPNSTEKSVISNPNQVSCGISASDITCNNQFQVSPLVSSSSISKSNLKSSPYDPMTNYLTPRPEFLRYDPNRRHEILVELIKDYENLSYADQEGESSSCNSPISSSISEIDLIQRETYEEIEEEDEDEEAEESYTGLKWALKFLLILGLLFVSTVYISNMNSPSPPPVIKAIRDLKDDCQRVGGELLKNLFYGTNEFDMGVFELNGYNATVDLGLVKEEDRDVKEEYADMGVFELNGYNATVDLGLVKDDCYRVKEGESDDGESEENDGKDIPNDLIVNGGSNGIVGNETGNDASDAIIREEVDEEPERNSNDEMTDKNVIGERTDSNGGFSNSFEEEKLIKEEVIKEEQRSTEILYNVKNDELLQYPWITTTTSTIREEVDEKPESDSKDEMNEKNSLVIDEEQLIEEEVIEKAKEEQGSTEFLPYQWITITSKEGIWVAMFSLLFAVAASVVVKCKKTSPIVTEAQEPKKKRTPCRPPTPPRQTRILPQVKLMCELDFGDVCSSPAIPLSSSAHMISQKQVAAADMGLSSTSVRRSMRIRNRKLTSS